MFSHDDGFDALIGQVADGFVVLQKVGVGASSAVYQAMEKAKNNRLVALKVMDATEQRLLVSSGNTGNPFEREARFSRVVRDSAIVRIFKTGKLGDGRYYVAMEFVKGMTLEEELRHRKTIPWREATELVRLTSSAVASLHAIDIIHRDLKPGNLMVRTGKDGRVRVKLIDFGIAKLSHERDDVGAGVDSSTIGTPSYMAPETALGGGTDRRSDVYALGAILYECLAGRRLIALKRPNAESVTAYLKTENPIPVVDLSDTVDARVPEELVELVHACVARDPLQRPKDAGEIGRTLADILERAGPEESPSALSRFAGKVKGLFSKKPRGSGKFAAK